MKCHPALACRVQVVIGSSQLFILPTCLSKQAPQTGMGTLNHTYLKVGRAAAEPASGRGGLVPGAVHLHSARSSLGDAQLGMQRNNKQRDKVDRSGRHKTWEYPGAHAAPMNSMCGHFNAARRAQCALACM